MAPEMAKSRARISMAKPSPSAVAVTGPSRNSTSRPPGKNRTLITTTLMATGSVRITIARSTGRIWPAIAAGSSTSPTTRMAGPITPPSAIAATLVPIATTSLVSGFSRW
jgi:hypothetical protein